MRIPSASRTGKAGEAIVMAKFAALGWGPVQNGPYDLGTDIYVQTYDDAGNDLRILLGVQVKSGPTAFRSTVMAPEGVITGWRFSIDQDHFEHWADHQIAHIIVLCDIENHQAYWQNLTSENVEQTGKQPQIFVPVDNTLDRDHLSALTNIAASRNNRFDFQGSVMGWNGTIPHAARIRYALVAPRLIAPHPNTTPDSVSASEAIALFVGSSHLTVYPF